MMQRANTPNANQNVQPVAVSGQWAAHPVAHMTMKDNEMIIKSNLGLIMHQCIKKFFF
jgi:hypothetical protein